MLGQTSDYYAARNAKGFIFSYDLQKFEKLYMKVNTEREKGSW